MKSDCRPDPDGICAKYPLRVGDAGVCDRCRETKGLSMKNAARIMDGRKPLIDKRDCPECTDKMAKVMRKGRDDEARGL